MKNYTIERWCGDVWGWKTVVGAPTSYRNRRAAEDQLEYESGIGGRFRLVNAKGKPVLHRGTVEDNRRTV